MNAMYSQTNTCAAAHCSGSFAASMASFLLIFTGIALAVSVVFFSAVILAVRLCVLVLVSISIIHLLAIIIPRTTLPRER